MKSIISTNFFTAKKDYKSLSIPTMVPVGIFEIEWIGSSWFQKTAKLGLGLFGFKNWYGKEFFGTEDAINVFGTKDSETLFKNHPMKIQIAPSAIDGKGCILVSYPKNSQLPWPYIVDEFRFYDENTLLGQSYAKFFPFFPMPFFLKRKESIEIPTK